MAALEAAAADGSWSANLRLGEIHERANGGDLAAQLRYYGRAAEKLDAELAVSESNDRTLRAYADEAFARRGSLAHYLTRQHQVDVVVEVNREIRAWMRAHRH
jgi:hypothetical protein